MMREFFYLQKSDRKVILALLTVIVIALGIILFTGSPSTSSISGTSRDSSHVRNVSNSSLPTRQVERFFFDPNTADSAQLRRLGLQTWQIEKTDFARLYGLTVKEYRELEPYIRISSDYLPAATLVKESASATAKHDTTFVHHYPQKIAETAHVVLNTADTTELMTVPGIGPYFARKIVQYGQRLGGYVNVDQLDEIENFPAESKRFLVVEGATPQKLNVNKLTLNELKRHPYINFYQAKDITDYRRLHGPIKSLQDLRLLKDFPQAAIERLLPYVTY